MEILREQEIIKGERLKGGDGKEAIWTSGQCGDGKACLGG